MILTDNENRQSIIDDFANCLVPIGLSGEIGNEKGNDSECNLTVCELSVVI